MDCGLDEDGILIFILYLEFLELCAWNGLSPGEGPWFPGLEPCLACDGSIVHRPRDVSYFEEIIDEDDREARDIPVGKTYLIYSPVLDKC